MFMKGLDVSHSSPRIEFRKYRHVILDFDGVILDSNGLKREAIAWAASEFLPASKCREFVDYFTRNNGMPRERKISLFFSDPAAVECILERYSGRLENSLRTAQFTSGFETFIKKLEFYGLRPYILSGGDTAEITTLLQKRGMLDAFSGVYGGPADKMENVRKMQLDSPVLFIGDSRVDFEVARRSGMDFVLMYGYTQFVDWRSLVRRHHFVAIKDLDVLTCGPT